LLADSRTAFVLVAAPRRDSIDEAGYFADRLAEAHQPVSALVVNRLHPDFRGAASAAPRGRATARGRASDGELGRQQAAVAPAAGRASDGELGREQAAVALAGMRQNLADLQLLADRERDYLETLESRIEGAVVKVPYLPQDVHDLAGLALVAACLTGQVLSERA